MFVEVLQQVTVRDQADAEAAAAERVAVEKGKRAPAPPPPARTRDEVEAAEAAEAEAEGRGVGEWRVPRLQSGEVCAAVSHLAVSLLLLGRELPRCLLGCGAAATAVMGLLGRLAARCGVRHVGGGEGAGGLGREDGGRSVGKRVERGSPAGRSWRLREPFCVQQRRTVAWTSGIAASRDFHLGH